MTEEKNNEQPIIIIKKIKKGHGGHHGGAWKVAFADFMTAMMAFFLVMWLVGQDDRVKENIAGYFRDPGKYQKMGKSGVLKGSDGLIKQKVATKGMIKPPKDSENAAMSNDESKMALTARNLLDELKKQQEFNRLKKNIKVQMTSEGLRITLNESEDASAFFEKGSARLLQKSAAILATIAKELGQLTNHIVIEGHTDNSPPPGKDYSNWELSADRANAARQLMEVSGLYGGQVREVRGYANKFPMIRSNPKDPRNRRISLIVLYEAREKMYDQIDVGEDLLSGL